MENFVGRKTKKAWAMKPKTKAGNSHKPGIARIRPAKAAPPPKAPKAEKKAR